MPDAGRIGATLPARVAVLEDDAALRDEILVPGLRAHGLDAEGFEASGDLYRRMLAASFDAILLDIGLPGEDGLSVARYLRAVSSVGIAVLTGRADRAERIRGLGESVDLWLSKPVDVAMIAASLESLVRRVRMAVLSPLIRAEVARWTQQAAGWRLQAPSGSSVELNRSERALLQRLFAAAGEPVSRDALIGELGEPSDSFEPHRLEVLVYRMRRKIIAALGHELPLRAVRGRGYVLTP